VVSYANVVVETPEIGSCGAVEAELLCEETGANRFLFSLQPVHHNHISIACDARELKSALPHWFSSSFVENQSVTVRLWLLPDADAQPYPFERRTKFWNCTRASRAPLEILQNQASWIESSRQNGTLLPCRPACRENNFTYCTSRLHTRAHSWYSQGLAQFFLNDDFAVVCVLFLH